MTQVAELWLKLAPPDAKREVGRRVNAVKAEVERYVGETQERVELFARQSTAALESLGSLDSNLQALKTSELERERLDITLPGIRRPIGVEHPVIKTMNEIVGVFRNLGYSVEEGPEIETDYYNFEALNFPPNHPARDTQDTLFLANQESKPLPHESVTSAPNTGSSARRRLAILSRRRRGPRRWPSRGSRLRRGP